MLYPTHPSSSPSPSLSQLCLRFLSTGCHPMFFTVLWIHICFTSNLDPAFCLNADPDQGSQTNADPCGSGPGSGSWSDFKVTKVEFYMKKQLVKDKKNVPKLFCKAVNKVYLLILINFFAPGSWSVCQYGSGSTKDWFYYKYTSWLLFILPFRFPNLHKLILCTIVTNIII